MIRKAVESDINAISDTYNELLTYEEKHGSNSNWKLGVSTQQSKFHRRRFLQELCMCLKKMEKFVLV